MTFDAGTALVYCSRVVRVLNAPLVSGEAAVGEPARFSS